jgi:hypothetical protein
MPSKYVSKTGNNSSTYPFRWMHWKKCEPLYKKQPAGTFAHYYAAVYEPKQKWVLITKKRVRALVKRFLVWHGLPIKLKEITNAFLNEFGKNEVTRGVSVVVVQQQAATLRLIVNDWHPRRLVVRNARELPVGQRGTVEHFVESKYLQATGRRGGKRAGRSGRNKTIAVVSRLHEFNGDKPLPFTKFTPELCERFLKWCLKEENGRRPVNADSVNTTYRFALVSISRDAAAAGLMKRRIFLEPVAPLKRKIKTSTNGHAASSAPKEQKQQRFTPPRGGGRPALWDHCYDWINAWLIANPGLNRTAARQAYAKEFPQRDVPTAAKLRALISRKRAKPK